MSLSYQLYRTLLKKCRALPPAEIFVTNDFNTSLFLTVPDLRLETTLVDRALEYCDRQR
jgi:hypothetical protein